MKNIVTLFAVIVSGLGLFYGGYYLHGNINELKQSSTALIDNSLVQRFQTTAVVEKDSPPHITRISSSLQFVVNSTDDHSIVGYNSLTGEIIRKDFTKPGTPSETLIKIRPSALRIQWSYNRTSLIASYRDKNIYYNLDGHTKEYTNNVIRPVLSSKGDQIAYIYQDESGNNSISVADPLLTTYQNILTTNAPWRLNWLNNQSLLIQSPDQKDLYVLNIETKSFDKIIENYSMNDFILSPDNQKLLYSRNDDHNSPQLSVYNITTKSHTNLIISAHSSQCAWSINSTDVTCVYANESGKSVISSINTSDQNKKDIFITEDVKDIIISTSLSINEDTILFTTNKNNSYFFPIQ
jgi:hypothetical protein